MRRLIPLLLALVACGDGDRRPSASDAPSSSTAASLGPDAILLRVPRAGGVARAYAYPRLDSAVWRSAQPAPAFARVLAFDEDAGSLAFVDAKGLPGRIDLRSGRVAAASKVKFASLSSSDGRGIYGLANGAVTRLTPTDSWPFKPPAPARELAPQPDGSLLVVAERPTGTVVWRVRPPDSRLGDSAVLGPTERAVRTRVGDRLYFVHEKELLGVRVRDLAPITPVLFSGRVRVVAPTPSGDRLYVTVDSASTLSVVDRYTGKVEETIALPGGAADLRMDALGRYLLVRPARGDSAWVIALGTNRLIGTVPTRWSADLPFVAPDGAVAASQGADVVFVDGETMRTKSRVAGGAKDFWHLFLWNGFRPRSAGLDQPVTFRNPAPDTIATDDAVDSALAAAPADSVATVDSVAVAEPAPTPVPTPTRPAPPAPRAAAPAPAPRAAAPAAQAASFLVQFASFPSEEKARAAANFSVKGATPHVSTTQVGGATIYRVVLGPYPSKAAAERVGKEAARDFWVYEAAP